MTPRLRIALGLGLLLWITVVLAAYYAVHKPLPASMGAAGEVWALLGRGVSVRPVLTALLDLAIAAWITLTALGCGAAALRRSGLALDPAQGIAFSTALGFGMLAALPLGLGGVQFLTPIWLLFGLGVYSAVALAELRRAPQRWLRELWAGFRAPQPLPIRLLQATLGVSTLLIGLQALAPPTAWDSLVYHLQAPRYYLAQSGIVSGLDIPHAYFPALLEQLFTLGMAAGSDTAPALLHLAVAVVGFVAIHGFLRARAGAPAAWVGVAVLASVTSLATLAGRAYVDWGVVTFGFLAFWALEEALWQRSRGWLVVSAILAGMTMGSKYTGIFPAAGVGLVLAWQVLRAERGPTGRAVTTRWRDLLLWGGVASLTVAPWLLRNVLLTGNPVYPLLFNGWQWDAWKTAWVTRPGTGLIIEPWRVVLAPWELTVLGQEARLYDATVGPLLLALLPLGLLCLWPRRQAGRWPVRAMAVAAVAYAGWLAGAAQSSLLVQGRLLLPVAPLLAVAIAGGWARLSATDAAPLRTGRLVAMVTGLVIMVSFAMLALSWVGNPPLPVLAGSESREAYQARRLGGYANATAWVNQELPPSAHVLQLWEPRTYLCQSRCQADAFLFNWRYLLHRHGDDGAAVAAALRAAGYTHVLVNGGGLRFFTEPPNVEAEPAHVEALHGLLAGYATLVQGTPLRDTLRRPLAEVAGSGYALYALKAGP